MPANPSPLTAPRAEDFRAWHRVQSAALSHDRPGEPLPTLTAVEADLTACGTGSRLVLWLVRGSGEEPVATAALRLFTDPGRSHVAEVDMTVHPAHRRMGAGSRLLATVTEAAGTEGCRSMVTQVPAGTPGEGFLATRDFHPVLRLTWLRLALDEIPDRIGKLPDVPHPGYRLTAWEGAVPDALAATYTAARQGIADLPATGPDLGGVRWNADRSGAAAEAVARRGERLLTFVALTDPGGEVAGYTEVVLPAGDTEQAGGSGRARQCDTAVLPAHRGHGLGLWLKAAMLRRLQAAHPRITEVTTDNAEDGRHLLAVNTALGFRPLRRTVAYRHTLRR